MPRWPGAFVTSFTTRVVMLVFVLQLFATATVMIYLDGALRTDFEARQRILVLELRDDLVAEYRENGPESLRRRIVDRMASPAWSDTVVMFADRANAPVGNLARWPADVAQGAAVQSVQLQPLGRADPATVGLVVTQLDAGRRLLTGRVIDADLRLHAIERDAIIASLVLAIPLALLVAGLTGRLIDHRLSAIARTVAAVERRDLSRRVPVNGSGDAFDRLSIAVNAMLDRLDALVGEMRVVTDGLAHDLRSPLTRLKSSIERVQVERDPGIAADELGRAETEVMLLDRMIETSLQISRSEAGIAGERVTVDVAQLLDDVAEMLGPVAEDRGIALIVECSRPLSARLDRQMIAQAMSNLIENAVNHAVGASRIVLAAKLQTDGVMLSVSDDGRGIPLDRHDDAVRRFVRLDPARGVPGTGLGLALVKAIAHGHSGTMTLADARPGLRVTLHLPSPVLDPVLER